MDSKSPVVIVFGGSNGAGKSTVAATVLPVLGVTNFVNADAIAKGLSQTAGADIPDEEVQLASGRLMLERMEELASERQSFAFETTLASRSHAVRLRKLKDTGYCVYLFFMTVLDVNTAVDRVQMRVERGGHHIPEETIRRRFDRSHCNFIKMYLPLADVLRVYNNQRGNELVAFGQSPDFKIVQPDTWKRILQYANAD